MDSSPTLSNALPWDGVDRRALTRAREGFCLAATLATAPCKAGSLPDLLGRAFHVPAEGRGEADLFAELVGALSPLAWPGFERRHAERAMAWAPALFGGIEWICSPERASEARMALCHAAAERLALDQPGHRALTLARALPWPTSDALARVPPPTQGPLEHWPASRASRQALALGERQLLGQGLVEGSREAPKRL
jgi:hypothetical protein